MKKIHILAALLLLRAFSFGQSYVQVADQTLTVNSTSNLTGRSRQYVRVDLPSNAIGYVYRATIMPKGATASNSNLLSLLANYAPKEIALGAQLTQLAVNVNDGNALDAFTFYNPYDADNFVAEHDNNWSSCTSNLNIINTCYSTNRCLNPTLFFGFRNNNLMQGLNVRLEIVAITDSIKQLPSVTYSILNATDQEIKFQLSNNQRTWESMSLRSGYVKSLTEDKPLFIRIYTSLFKFVNYKLDPNERYRIIWSNQGKWDLIRY
jgi:hypothetical protein